MLRRCLQVCAIVTCLCLPGQAADPKIIYDESTHAMYNLDFNTAQRGYETLTRDYSENPDYWNALASAMWFRIMYDQQKLNMESFSGRSLGTRDSHDAVDPADEKRFRETLATAVAKADELLKKNPKDTHALYAKGISNATLASFEASAKRAYLTAGSKAKTARDLHQQVLAIDPTFDDARMSIGAYNYVIGVVPGYLRVPLVLLGIRGEGKEIGIQQLQTAAEKGKTTSTDARMLLIVVYNRERRYDEAVKILDDLHEKYPRNFVLDLTRASTLGKMKRWDDAVDVYQQMLTKIEQKKDGYERLRPDRVYYPLGSANVELLQLSPALDAFGHVVNTKDAPVDERARAYLWMGKIHDSRNERTEAIVQYDAVLGLDCDPDLKRDAQRYKRTPYK